MIPVFLHEYKFSHTPEERTGVIQVTIHTVTETSESEFFEAVGQAMTFLEDNLKVSHKILIEGFKKSDGTNNLNEVKQAIEESR